MGKKFEQDEDEAWGKGVKKCANCGEKMPYGISDHIANNIDCEVHYFNKKNDEEISNPEKVSKKDLEKETKAKSETEPENYADMLMKLKDNPSLGAETNSESESYMNEEKIYELISEEIENNSTKKGTWTKAFSESEGDEQKTKALYIKYRFDQIKDGQSQTDEEYSRNKNEELDTSGNKSICYLCGKENANLKVIFDGEHRQFCNDECYDLCIKKRTTAKKSQKEQLEYWEDKNKKLKEESKESNDLDQFSRLKFYFYLKILIGIDIFLIILGFAGGLKVDFLILSLGTWLVLLVTFYIYYFWKIEKYNFFTKLFISVVAFSFAVIVNVVYDFMVLKPQKEIWYKESLDKVLRKIEK